MDASTAQLIRFLQRESARLQEETITLRQENQALRHYVSALEELNLAAQRISSEENLLDLLHEILQAAMQIIRAEDGSVLLLDEQTDELAFAVVHGDIEGELRGYRIGVDVGIAGWVASEGQTVIANDPHRDWRFSSQIDEAFGFVTRSLLCVPMVTRGKTVGVIELLNKYNHDNQFGEADANLLAILGHVAACALEDMRARLEAEEQASN